MSQQEIKEMPNGLYRIYWKEGGSSLAAVGCIYNGDRWMAPCNWTSRDYDYPKVATCHNWRKVERVELIVPVTNYGEHETESL